jgi:hypothetical protein
MFGILSSHTDTRQRLDQPLIRPMSMVQAIGARDCGYSGECRDLTAAEKYSSVGFFLGGGCTTPVGCAYQRQKPDPHSIGYRRWETWSASPCFCNLARSQLDAVPGGQRPAAPGARGSQPSDLQTNRDRMTATRQISKTWLIGSDMFRPEVA